MATRNPGSGAPRRSFTVPPTTSPTISESDLYYGQEPLAKLAARFITHLFACPDYPQASGQSQAKLHYFIAYALHRTKLHPAVTFSALILLQRLKARFPSARGSSGHRLFISAYMISSKVMCDDTYSNKSWCIVAQAMFTLREINQMEREMCQYLDWELTVDPTTLSNFETAVKKDFQEDRGRRTYPNYPTTFVTKLAPRAEASTSNTPFDFDVDKNRQTQTKVRWKPYKDHANTLSPPRTKQEGMTGFPAIPGSQSDQQLLHHHQQKSTYDSLNLPLPSQHFLQSHAHDPTANWGSYRVILSSLPTRSIPPLHSHSPSFERHQQPHSSPDLDVTPRGPGWLLPPWTTSPTTPTEPQPYFIPRQPSVPDDYIQSYLPAHLACSTVTRANDSPYHDVQPYGHTTSMNPRAHSTYEGVLQRNPHSSLSYSCISVPSSHGSPPRNLSLFRGSDSYSQHHLTHPLSPNIIRRRWPDERVDPADGRNGSESAHPHSDFHYGDEDIGAGRGYDTSPEERKPQPATLTRFDIVSLGIYLLSLLFIREKDRPPLHDIRLAISNVMRSERDGILSRRMPAPFKELRERTPGDDPQSGVTPSTGPGIFANSQNTAISGGTFSVVHQTIGSDPSVRKSVKHIVYLLSFQTAMLF